MRTKWQFQNLAWRRTLQNDDESTPTVILPSITLPVQRELLIPSTPQISSTPGLEGLTTLVDLPESVEEAAPVSHKKKLLRGVALVLSLFLLLALYFTWRSVNANAAPPAVLQQNYGNASATPTADSSGANNANTGTIQVYILGAVKNPGVYSMPADARVYQLVQAAGGLLPTANMVALNMAAKLTDGEEIYVLAVGEIAPPGTNSPVGASNGTPGTLAPGQRVNINTATEAELRQALHVSAATAQKIIAYRTQHGAYTSVDQLLQVISQSVYTRIKNMVTV